jgi:hypothetical protein
MRRPLPQWVMDESFHLFESLFKVLLQTPLAAGVALRRKWMGPRPCILTA